MHRVVLKRPAEDDRHLAPRIDTFDDLPLHDAGRRANTAVHRGLGTMKRWQAGQVSLDQRFHRGHSKLPTNTNVKSLASANRLL